MTRQTVIALSLLVGGTLYPTPWAGGGAISRLCLLKMLLFVCLALPLCAGCATPPSPAELARGNYGAYPNEYQAIIKQHMRYRLKDPESAQYTFAKGPNRAWHKYFGDLRFGHAVCVEINAKNSYGGYEGVKLYYFLIHDQTIVRQFGDSQIEQGLAKDLCAKS